jgi:hypothetical protein
MQTKHKRTKSGVVSNFQHRSYIKSVITLLYCNGYAKWLTETYKDIGGKTNTTNVFGRI